MCVRTSENRELPYYCTLNFNVVKMHPHTVSLIPELLEKILNFMNRDHNVTNACVCKQWSEIALDIVWREVKSLPRLLGLLRPYEKRDASFIFDRQPDLRDWARFQKYANRVRTLRYRQGLDDYSCLLDHMARTRTTLHILPNLHTLEWIFDDKQCMERATLFMHQQVKHIIISAPPQALCDNFGAVTLFFVDICTRMPHIHLLDFRNVYTVRFKSIEADVLELLRRLPDLKKVIFPEFYLTSTLVSELSRKKHIKTIKIEHQEELGEEGDAGSFSPALEQGAFPVLQDLDITVVRLGDVTRFMNADFAPVNITYLYITTYVEHQPKQLHTLLATLSEQCRLLSRLHIKLLHIPKVMKLASAKQITFDTLRPVLSLNLTTFELIHKYPVDITLAEIEELASRWPSLEDLHLNEEPLVMSDFTLDLRALCPLARHCQKLRRLGLFMDASGAKIHSTQESKPFTALSVLSVGTSQVRDPGAVAAFLSHMCPPGCTLTVHTTWTSYGNHSCRKLDTDVICEAERRSIAWAGVKDLLPLFIQLRREEREKSRALRAEVEDLRTRKCLPVTVDPEKVSIKVRDPLVSRARGQTRAYRRIKTAILSDPCIIV
ncbi:hypothetical protein M405DRAFT_883697 [Rhizopogon salebrosus TDB-379]|nr:hypothetical protein M405DRAFT_883697 [Rhizopogon salebrosus TDB-379]